MEQFKPFNCVENNLEPYECEICPFTTNLRVSLQKHVSSHSLHDPEAEKAPFVVKTYSCPKCVFVTLSDLVFTRHSQLCNKRPFFYCDQCQFKSKWKGSVTKHMMFLHTNKMTQCHKCPFKTRWPSTLKTHFKYVHLNQKRKKKLQCSQCSYITSIPSYLKSHVAAKHETPKNASWFECKCCGLKMRRSDQANRHLRKVHGVTLNMDSEIKFFQCDLCEYITDSDYAWNMHTMMKHSSNKINHTTFELSAGKNSGSDDKLQCDQCSYQTKHLSVLNYHKGMKHDQIPKSTVLTYQRETTHFKESGSDTIFQCKYCLYRATNQRLFHQHVKRQHCVLLCKFCPFATRSKDAFECHARIKHQREAGEMHRCHFCDFKTIRKSLLDVHHFSKHSHETLEDTSLTQNKSSNRTVDDKVCVPQSDLLICEKCGYQAKDLKILQYHVGMKHSFYCKHCRYKSDNEQNLQKHMRCRHPKYFRKSPVEVPTIAEWLQCNRCPYKTKWQGSLEVHKVLKHPNDEKQETLDVPESIHSELLIKSEVEENVECFESENVTKGDKLTLDIDSTEASKSDNGYDDEQLCEGHMSSEHTMRPIGKHDALETVEIVLQINGSDQLIKTEIVDLNMTPISDKSDAIVDEKLQLTELKLFKCTRCSFQSEDLNGLKYHKQMRQIYCDQCMFKTVDACEYQKHLTSHLDSKSFKCEYCKVTTTTKSNLNRHVKNKHPKRWSQNYEDM